MREVKGINHKLHCKITTRELDEMIKLRKSGFSYKQIAAIIGCSTTTATRHTKHIKPKTIKDRIIEMLIEGKTHSYIISETGSSVQYVYMISKQIDIKAAKKKRVVKKTNEKENKSLDLEEYQEEVAKICSKVQEDKVKYFKDLEKQKQVEIDNCRWKCNVRI